MNATSKAAPFRWCLLGGYIAGILACLFLPYIEVMKQTVSFFRILTEGTVGDMLFFVMMGVVVCVLSLGMAVLMTLPKSVMGLGPRFGVSIVFSFLCMGAHVAAVLWLNNWMSEMTGGLSSLINFIGVGFYINVAWNFLLCAASVIGLILAGRGSAAPRVTGGRPYMPAGQPYAPAPPPGYYPQPAAPAGAPHTASRTGGVILGVNGMYKNAVFPIVPGEELIIGRDAALSNIIVDTGAEKVSRRHCSVTYDAAGRRYQVVDFSTNGTYKDDGTRLVANMPFFVPSGTTIYLGDRQNGFMLK